MSPADTRDEILRNARSQERERLRNIARKNWPDLDGDDLEDKVRELESEKMRAAGRRGRAAQLQSERVGRQWQTLRPELEDLLQRALIIVRADQDDAA